MSRAVTLVGGPVDGRTITVDAAAWIVIPVVNDGRGPTFQSHRYDGYTGAYIGIDPEPPPYIQSEPTWLDVVRSRVVRAVRVLRGRDEIW